MPHPTSIRSSILLALLIVLLAGCTGTRTGPPPSRPADPTLDPDLSAEIGEAVALRTDFGLRADVEHVGSVHAAPDSVRHEIGILVSPEEADELNRRFGAQDELGALTAYGAEHADTFGGMYIDQAAGGDVVLLFTRDVERHARAAAALAPVGVIVRVRQVDSTEAELAELLEGLDLQALGGQELEMVGAGIDIIRNVVTLEVKTNDPSFEERMESQSGGRLDVTVHPVPGPWQNASDGDGWRLIAFGEAGGEEAYTVHAATDQEAFVTMWTALGLDGDVPAVEFAEEVIVSFGHGIGSSCREMRLDDVTIEGGEVFSLTSDPLSPRACTSDLAGAAVFVVAVSRDALPANGFTLRLSHDPLTCGAECGSSEEIEVLLR